MFMSSKNYSLDIKKRERLYILKRNSILIYKISEILENNTEGKLNPLLRSSLNGVSKSVISLVKRFKYGSPLFKNKNSDLSTLNQNFESIKDYPERYKIPFY